MIYLLVDRQSQEDEEEEENEGRQVNRENRNTEIKQKYWMNWQQQQEYDDQYSFHLSSFLEAISIIDFDIQRTQTIEFQNQEKLIQASSSVDLIFYFFFLEFIYFFFLFSEKIRFDAK